MDGIYLSIMSSLSPLEIIKLGQCDKHLRNLSLDESLWKSLTLKHYPACTKSRYPFLSWKQYYLELYLFSQVSCLILSCKDQVYPVLDNYRFFFDHTLFTLQRIDTGKENNSGEDVYYSDFIVKARCSVIKQDFLRLYQAWTEHMQGLGYADFYYLIVYSE
nr:hypothetical protein Cbor_493 [Cedratvirus borely]WIL03631.1 hypothetical protein Cplu_494 [Cedratvirus plubellavi]